MSRKPRHKEWAGFTPIYNREGTKIDSAMCNNCGKYLQNYSEKRLKLHKDTCNGNKSSNVQDRKKENCENQQLNGQTTSNSHDCSKRTSESPEGNYLKSSKKQKTHGTTSYNEKSNSLLKFMLSHEIDFTRVTSRTFTEFISALDPTFIIPSVKELETNIMESLSTNFTNLNLQQSFLNTVSLQTFKNNDKLYAFMCLITSQYDLVFLSHIEVNVTNDYEIEMELETFCDLCVVTAKEKANVEVKFVISDFEFACNEIDTVMNRQYFRILTFSKLISDLKSVQTDIFLNDKAEHYFEAIDILEKKCDSKSFKLSEAVEYIFELVEKDFLREHVGNLNSYFKSVLSPIPLAANFFNYKFHGNRFMEYVQLAKTMLTFVESHLPEEELNGLGEYRLKTGEFIRYFEGNEQLEAKRFWIIYKPYYKVLSEFAIPLVEIPAVPRKIDLHKVLRMLSKYTQNRNESITNLLVSLAIN